LYEQFMAFIREEGEALRARVLDALKGTPSAPHVAPA